MAAFNKAFPGPSMSILRINSVSESSPMNNGYMQPDLWISENAGAITARGAESLGPGADGNVSRMLLVDRSFSSTSAQHTAPALHQIRKA